MKHEFKIEKLVDDSGLLIIWRGLIIYISTLSDEEIRVPNIPGHTEKHIWKYGWLYYTKYHTQKFKDFMDNREEIIEQAKKELVKHLL